MKKAINKILTGVGLTALNAGIVLADGGDVYGSHDPIDTGLESGIFYLIALVSFVLGLATLFVVKTLKAKASIK
jgi:hypothetical protein